MNQTLECTVSRNDLSWEVDNLHFESYSAILHERGIYQSEQIASSEGLSSILLVLGNMAENNGTKVCCETLVRRSLVDICTILIFYGKEQNCLIIIVMLLSTGELMHALVTHASQIRVEVVHACM